MLGGTLIKCFARYGGDYSAVGGNPTIIIVVVNLAYGITEKS